MRKDSQKSQDVLEAERIALKNARDLAKLAVTNGGRKILNPPVQIDGQKFIVFDDKATIRILPAD